MAPVGWLEKCSFSITLVGLDYIYYWPQAPTGILPCGCLPRTLETCQISELCNFTQFTPHSHLPASSHSLFQSISKPKYNPFTVSCHSFSPAPGLHLPKYVYSQPVSYWLERNVVEWQEDNFTLKMNPWTPLSAMDFFS